MKSAGYQAYGLCCEFITSTVPWFVIYQFHRLAIFRCFDKVLTTFFQAIELGSVPSLNGRGREYVASEEGIVQSILPHILDFCPISGSLSRLRKFDARTYRLKPISHSRHCLQRLRLLVLAYRKLDLNWGACERGKPCICSRLTSADKCGQATVLSPG